MTHTLIAELYRAAAEGARVNGDTAGYRQLRRQARIVLRKDRIGSRRRRGA